MAMREKRFKAKMTFLERLRQAGARVARLVETAAVPSWMYLSDVACMPPEQLNEARLVARPFSRETQYRRPSLLEPHA